MTASKIREGFILGQREILKNILDTDVTLEEVLAQLVAIAEEFDEGMVASILLLDESGKHLTHTFSPNLPLDYARAIDGGEIGARAGSCGTAAFRGERVVVEDIASDPLWADYRDLALQFGLRACWSEPFFAHSDKLLGTLAFYYKTVRAPGAWQREVLTDLGQLAGIAVVHKRMYANLVSIQSRLAEAQEIAHIGSWELDLTENRLWWSDEVYRIFSVDPEEMEPTYEWFLDCVHPEDRDMVDEAFSNAVAQHEVYDITHRLLLRNGTVRYVHERCRTYYDDGGNPVRSMGTVQDISDQRIVEERLSWLSCNDDLTELPNRRMFLDRLSMAIELCKRTNQSLVVIYFDLDRFKLINDSLGHSVGDFVLRTVADRVDQELRASDTVARFGGDEFAIMLPNSGIGSAISVAKKISEAIAQPIVLDEQELVMSVSAGAVIYPDDGDDPQTLLKHADIAMYRAKSSGDYLCLFSDEMGERLRDRLALEHELSRAVDRGQFSVHYQLKMVLPGSAGSQQVHSQTLEGFEALLRWQHPDKGWISPAEFIPLAEETGRIQSVTQWVVETVSRQALEWVDMGLRPPRISINISAIQLMHHGLAEDILSWISASGGDPSWLEVEITETAAMHNAEAAIGIMEHLTAAGLTVSIDDFGTGYSSLAYLKRIPASIIKIDQSFIRGLPDDSEDLAIVRSTIAMAHALEKRVVAEGIETSEQLACLNALDCDAGQGYLLGRPQGAEETTNYLKSLQQSTD